MMIKFKRGKDKDEGPLDSNEGVNDDEIFDKEIKEVDEGEPSLSEDEQIEDHREIEDDEAPTDDDKDENEESKDDEEIGDEEEEEKDKPWISAFWDISKDVIIAFIIVLLIISSIFIYTGNWPPVVVVESDSMQHHDTQSSLGVIDTGDLVLVKKIESRSDVITYMQGKFGGDHETYGEWGDVLIYRKNGYSDITPVIHRAIIWVEYNETSHSFDIPQLKNHNAPDEWDVISGERRWYNLSSSIILKEIGYDKHNVQINLASILSSYQTQNVTPHSGFITLGDHNKGSYDQNSLPDGHGGRVRPIKPEWVVGVARGEIPWFGLIKLYFQDNTITQRAPSNSFTMLWISLILIFAIPISIDIVLILYDRRKEKLSRIEDENKDSEDKEIEKEPGGEEEESINEEDPPPPEEVNE
jgi:signal peptidase